MQLTFAQLPEVLAKMNGVSGDAGGAFRAYLRKLRAEGIPGGANPGKGRRVAYTVPLVIEATIAIELLQMGWLPSQAAGLVRAHRGDMIAATLLALTPGTDSDQDVLMAVSSVGPGARALEDRANMISFLTRENTGLLFKSGPSSEDLAHDVSRWSIIDLASATLMTLGSIAHIGFPIDVAVEALQKAVDEYGASIRHFQQTRLNKIAIPQERSGTVAPVS